VTSPLRHTRQNRGGGSISLRRKPLGATLPLRHRSQGGSLSKKTARILALYEEDLGVRYAALTVKSYMGHVRAWLGWLVERGGELHEVRSEDLLAYQSGLYAQRKRDGRAYSAGFHTNRLKALKSFFRFLHRRGYVLHDPSAALEYPHAELRLPREILTPEEAKQLVLAVKGRSPRALRDRALIETLYSSGIRLGELAHLTPSDVDTSEQILRVVLGKGRKDRYVPLTRTAARAIERYMERGRPALVASTRAPYLFLTNAGYRLHGHAVVDILKERSREAGLKKRVTTHTVRHSIATHLLKGGADIRHIQTFLGHASLQSTERYTRVEIEDLKDVLRRAHPRSQ